MAFFFFLCSFLYLALHITGLGIFPRPLNSQEEKQYLEAAALGDPSAKEMLIEHNLRLVAHIVKKYYASFREQEDLISIGTIGLIKAVNTFNPQRNTKFSTYASRCIENEVLMYFRSKRKSAQDVFISDPIDTDREGNALTLMDIMSDDDTLMDQVDLRMKSQKLYTFLSEVLDEREQQILILRYGLFGRVPLTQREVAQKMHISRSYVSRRHYCKRCSESRLVSFLTFMAANLSRP